MEQKFTERKERGNIIRVADKAVERYAFAILLAAQPDVYEKHEQIKIQVTVANLNTAELLIKCFRHLGLEEIDRKKVEIKVTPASGQNYVLPNCFEITLKKIPALLHV